MKNIEKGKIIHGGMVRGRRTFLLINIILTGLLVIYVLSSMPYIKNRFNGPYQLDVNNFVTTTKDITIEDEIEMKKREEKSISSYAYMDTSYCEGDKYRFDVVFDDVTDTGIEYTYKYTDESTGESVEKVLHSVLLGKIGKRDVLILCNEGQAPVPGSPITGIFNSHSRVILSDLSKNVDKNGTYKINEYIFDTRNIEMDAENSNLFLCVLGLLLLIFLYVRLIRYYINPLSHPSYRQIDKYGELNEVVSSIEQQFSSEDVEKRGNAYYTTDWIMTKELFRNKIVINHCTRGRYS